MTSIGQPCCCCATKAELESPSTTGCPGCGVSSSHWVKAVTLKALLKGPEQGRISRADYLLCAGQDCPVVYFDPEGVAVFAKDQVSVRIGFKEADAPRPLCYCFGQSWESLHEEWWATGQSTAVASISESMRSAGCRCEETNPMGICCLADVAMALEQLQR